jgi:hypothetical protein
VAAAFRDVQGYDVARVKLQAGTARLKNLVAQRAPGSSGEGDQCQNVERAAWRANGRQLDSLIITDEWARPDSLAMLAQEEASRTRCCRRRRELALSPAIAPRSGLFKLRPRGAATIVRKLRLGPRVGCSHRYGGRRRGSCDHWPHRAVGPQCCCVPW